MRGIYFICVLITLILAWERCVNNIKAFAIGEIIESNVIIRIMMKPQMYVKMRNKTYYINEALMWQ